MKTFVFDFEDGPVAYNCHTVEIQAVNYSQAFKRAVTFIKEHYSWNRIGYHNIHYRGLKK